MIVGKLKNDRMNSGTFTKLLNMGSGNVYMVHKEITMNSG